VNGWFLEGKYIPGFENEKKQKLESAIRLAASSAIVRNITRCFHNQHYAVWVDKALPSLRKMFGRKVVSKQEIVRYLVALAQAKTEGRKVEHRDGGRSRIFCSAPLQSKKCSAPLLTADHSPLLSSDPLLTPKESTPIRSANHSVKFHYQHTTLKLRDLNKENNKKYQL
jgi:hypothetical protein